MSAVRLPPLTFEQFAECVSLALARMGSSARQGLDPASVYERTFLQRLDQEVLGLCAERAVAAAWHLEWHAPGKPLNTWLAYPDFVIDGVEVEVRASAHDDAHLIIRDQDPQNRVYLLVTGEPPQLLYRGWMWGTEARQWQWHRGGYGPSRRPAFWVPQHFLH